MIKRRILIMLLSAIVLSVAGCGAANTQETGEAAQDAAQGEETNDVSEGEETSAEGKEDAAAEDETGAEEGTAAEDQTGDGEAAGEEGETGEYVESEEEAAYYAEPIEELDDSLDEELTEEELEKEASMDVPEDSLSDYNVSDPKTNVVWFDLDGDFEDERITFDVNDPGDGTPSSIKVTAELPDGIYEATIDDAYALTFVCVDEDKQGPRLFIGYAVGDDRNFEDEDQCYLKLRDGELVVKYLSADDEDEAE